MTFDAPFGVSLTKRDDETALEYVLSFSPMAPFFGVPWRFGAMWSLTLAPGQTPFARAAEEKAADEAVEDAVIVAEPAEPAARDEAAPVEAPREEAARDQAACDDAPRPEAPRDDAQPAAAPAAPPAADPEGAPEADLFGVVAAQGKPADDLKRIKGIGPKLQEELAALGIRTFAQLGALDEEGLAQLNARLTAVRGLRPEAIEEARRLAAEG
ncbi:hypothetical protein [Oceanicella actignis]|uniref:Predicted 5' DNA nuclease, flap endonuclease-1-like, helix-3-turn-helix (H3TH) domain n=1 Tax=Oceanicella actignis TaxID=1189325 RepID=A0A1M7TX85_9RHOB|nr:hypothetical protein [Oceanicella actignis]SET80023.1 NADH-quinone oxidoreductase subunit E [Oceanicella actignis]SHN75328.1 Predicted 5' DNA nuclease, flap endonuclease-1-like, helix-3-turn-helix (H3TH) domain [Oceanicella actignis]